MKYTLSQHQVEFEIPDEWLEESGAIDFKPVTPVYAASSNDNYPTEIKPFSLLQAPKRNPGVTWFKKERAISIIKGITAGETLPPVEVHLKPGESFLSIKNGFHRYYIAAALGFRSLPVSVRPYF